MLMYFEKIKLLIHVTNSLQNPNDNKTIANLLRNCNNFNIVVYTLQVCGRMILLQNKIFLVGYVLLDLLI